MKPETKNAFETIRQHCADQLNMFRAINRAYAPETPIPPASFARMEYIIMTCNEALMP